MSEAKAWAELGILLPKKTKMIKKKTVRRRTTTTRTNFVPAKLFTFLSKVLTFLSLQKLFLMFSTTPIYPKNVLGNFFANKKFFFFDFFFFRIFFFYFFFFSIFFFQFFLKHFRSKWARPVSFNYYYYLVFLRWKRYTILQYIDH